MAYDGALNPNSEKKSRKEATRRRNATVNSPLQLTSKTFLVKASKYNILKKEKFASTKRRQDKT